MGKRKMKAQCLLNYDVLSVGEEHKLYLLVRVKGAREKGQREPLPLNLSVVIDRSGSMGGDKLAYVKQAALDLVRRLGAKDRLSLVAYDTQVEVLVSPMAVDQKQPFERAIQGLQSRATTNLSGGWLQGCEFVASGHEEKHVNRVLLLTDGLANVGVRDPNALAAMSRQKRSEGITTTTLGVGMGFNEDLLTKMASEGGGAFYFIDSPDQSPGIFSEELQDLLNVVGQNLTVALEVEKPVKAVQQLYDYPRHDESGTLVYKLGDIYAEEERHQVFELTLTPLKKGETVIGKIVVSYDAIEGEKVVRQESGYEIRVKAVPESELEVVLPALDVEKLALLQKAARAREKAIQHADRREFEQAASALRAVAQAIEASDLEDEELQAAHSQLLEDAMDMELGAQRYDAHTRKAQSAKVSSSRRHLHSAPMVAGMHMRMHASRDAIERGGPAPVRIAWGRKSIELKGKALLIGSEKKCDIVLLGAAPEHCRLERDGDDWFLIKMGGLTIANSGMVHDRFRLSVGDLVSVGGTLLRMKGEPSALDQENMAVFHLRQGQNLEQQDNFPAAISCYRKALALHTNNENTAYLSNNNLGFSLNQVGEFAEAEDYCRKAIAIDDARHNAYKNLGVSLEGQGAFADAARYYIMAVEKHPGDPRALNHLKQLIKKHPKIEKKIDDLDAIIERLEKLVAAERAKSKGKRRAKAR